MSELSGLRYHWKVRPEPVAVIVIGSNPSPKHSVSPSCPGSISGSIETGVLISMVFEAGVGIEQPFGSV